MATVMVFAFGIKVAVGAIKKGDVSCPGSGLGISTGAMKGGTGVACTMLPGIQLENNSAHRDRIKKR